MIPPESLLGFQEIVLSDRRINEDAHLRELVDKIQDAVSRNSLIWQQTQKRHLRQALED